MYCQEFQKTEQGRQFQHAIERWSTIGEYYHEDQGLDIAEAMHRAFVDTEVELGTIDIGFVGPIMMYVVSCWLYGEKFGLGLTPIETKLLADAFAEEQRRLQEDANTPAQ